MRSPISPSPSLTIENRHIQDDCKQTPAPDTGTWIHQSSWPKTALPTHILLSWLTSLSEVPSAERSAVEPAVFREADFVWDWRDGCLCNLGVEVWFGTSAMEITMRQGGKVEEKEGTDVSCHVAGEPCPSHGWACIMVFLKPPALPKPLWLFALEKESITSQTASKSVDVVLAACACKPQDNNGLVADVVFM
jgi:hypothetical protein